MSLIEISSIGPVNPMPALLTKTSIFLFSLIIKSINLEDSVKEVISNFKSFYFFGDGNFFGFLLVP